MPQNTPMPSWDLNSCSSSSRPLSHCPIRRCWSKHVDSPAEQCARQRCPITRSTSSTFAAVRAARSASRGRNPATESDCIHTCTVRFFRMKNVCALMSYAHQCMTPMPTSAIEPCPSVPSPNLLTFTRKLVLPVSCPHPFSRGLSSGCVLPPRRAPAPAAARVAAYTCKGTHNNLERSLLIARLLSPFHLSRRDRPPQLRCRRLGRAYRYRSHVLPFERVDA